MAGHPILLRTKLSRAAVIPIARGNDENRHCVPDTFSRGSLLFAFFGRGRNRCDRIMRREAVPTLQPQRHEAVHRRLHQM
jgi:hypothetical protein